MEFIMSDLVNDYVTLVRRVRDTGSKVTVRGQGTRELTAVTLIFPNILAPMLPVGVGRGVNAKLAALEALQLISGGYHHDLVLAAAPTFEDVLVDLEDPRYGAYGPRTVEQIANCVAILRADPLTRQAVISIWQEDDLTHVGDKPCTIFLQFLVRPGADGIASLELHTHMRSQDIWLGTPYDVFMFTQLQHTVARDLGLPTGQYVHHTTSLHVYERDVLATHRLTSSPNSTGAHLQLKSLPYGVIVPDSDNPEKEDPYDVATYLIEKTAEVDEVDANIWYARQLDRIDGGGRVKTDRHSTESSSTDGVTNLITGSVTGTSVQAKNITGGLVIGQP